MEEVGNIEKKPRENQRENQRTEARKERRTNFVLFMRRGTAKQTKNGSSCTLV